MHSRRSWQGASRRATWMLCLFGLEQGLDRFEASTAQRMLSRASGRQLVLGWRRFTTLM